ncbi:HAD-like protein [Trichoderma austrokoningii]
MSLYKAIILDLNGVLLSYGSSVPSGSLKPSQIKNVLDSPTWYEYECGNLTRQDCYERVSREFNVDLDVWTQTLEQLTKTVKPYSEFIAAIKNIKAAFPDVKVYGMSNISQPDYEFLKPMISAWGLLDGFQTSGQTGVRKPNHASYIKFLETYDELDAPSCIFVDDRVENVVAAAALGFKGVTFSNPKEVERIIWNLLGDPVDRGMEYMERNAKKMMLELSTGGEQPDNFSQFIILELTRDKRLIKLDRRQGPTWNYFHHSNTFMGTTYSDDCDTTSYAMCTLDDIPAHEKEAAMDAILNNLSPDNLPLCWFNKNRPRLCHGIIANAFRFFCLQGQGHKLAHTYLFLCRLLRTKTYELGSRYYENIDYMPYILSNLCSRRPTDPSLAEMRELLKTEIRDRAGCDSDVLGAALRTLSAQAMGVPYAKRDMRVLLESQQLDGGWNRVWLFKYGKEDIKVGSRGVITAMAVKALRQYAEDEGRIV